MSQNNDPFIPLQNLLQGKELEPGDLKNLFNQYNSTNGQAEVSDLLDQKWEKSSVAPSLEIDSKKIQTNIARMTNPSRKDSGVVKTLLPWLAGAAAAVIITLLISAGFFFDIRLKNNDFAYLREVTAPQGKIKRLELPDGTLVWLNPGSSVTFSETMTKDEIRDVRLWGQAYFKVAKNPGKPFILQLGDIGLRVTGTSFNASNYKDDTIIEVVLEEGQVKLFEGMHENATQFIPLNPGQMGTYNKGRKGFNITSVDINQYTSWMDGVLIFRDELMSNVFRKLERWYDVKIVVDDPKINNYTYTATIKNESLGQILQLLEYTSQLSCEQIKTTGPQAHKPTILIKSKN